MRRRDNTEDPSLASAICVAVGTIELDPLPRLKTDGTLCPTLPPSLLQEHDLLFHKHAFPPSLTRSSTARDVYEKEARDIRYSTYKEVLLHTGATAVLLGHHRGDVEVSPPSLPPSLPPSSPPSPSSLCIHRARLNTHRTDRPSLPPSLPPSFLLPLSGKRPLQCAAWRRPSPSLRHGRDRNSEWSERAPTAAPAAETRDL